MFKTIRVVFKLPGVTALIKRRFFPKEQSLVREKMGLRFLNPVGLAAGFDKDALLYKELSAFGFSFIEVGTLTPKSQPGNARPRMFRLPEIQGLINRMGFNNKGVHEAANRLKKRDKDIIIGGNIGKNKDTPISDAVNDYIYCFNALFNEVDYFAVNVSSPNTPGLRGLQEKKPLTELLQSLQKINLSKAFPKPILLKIAPDLSFEQVDEVIAIVQATKLAGIIASNTTISRDGIGDIQHSNESGGLSGKPLQHLSTELIRYIRVKAGAGLVIIGVGGINTAADAEEKLKAGADLVQVYTGFIYEGPAIARNICNGLLKISEQKGKL